MKTELPVEGYASAHALMEAMQGTNGDTFWLAKAEGHWHGGIHLKDSISGTSGFRSMTDGHIVAYRLNDDYLRAPSGPKMLKFTSTFILIKSTCTPDADKPANALDFYTLWMQLSPLSKYGGDKPALVTASSLKVRQDSAENRWARGGIPAGHSVNASGENLSLYGAPVDSGGTLPRGTEVEILEEASFFLKRRASPFVFVRVISVPLGKDSSLAVGETGWVSGLGKYLKRQPSTIPGWMQKVKARGEFNQVVTLAGDDLIAVAAGEKIGHAGNHESPGAAPCAFSHLEIFSQDSRFPDFVENKAGLSVGGKLLRSEAGKTLWRYRERENRFVAMEGDSARQTGDRQFTKLTDAKKTEVDGRLWYFIDKENGWLPASDVTEVEQYDLAERGFVMLVQEEPPTDVTKGFQESWLREVYGKLEAHSTKQNGMYSLSLTEYYQKRLRKWDLDGDQKLSGYEIWRGLHCRESWCSDIVQRLLVKHHSEWLHDADSALWRPRLAELSKRNPTIAQYNHAHINALVWMKDVPEIRSGEALWHMHPLVFLDAISTRPCACNRDITLDELCAIAPKTNTDALKTYIRPFNDGFKQYGINSCREKAHFLAQCCHESGGLRLTVEGGGSQKSYAPWYGRGLIQLTHQDAYIKYGISVSDDFISSDMARNKLSLSPDCVLSAFWFYMSYDNKKINEYAKKDDFNMVTARVNGGFNGYNDRLKYFNKAVEVLNAEHLSALQVNGVFNFENSSIYNNRVYSYSWGRYHDPLREEQGTSKSKFEALIAYNRALSLYVQAGNTETADKIRTRISSLSL